MLEHMGDANQIEEAGESPGCQFLVLDERERRVTP